MEDIRSAVDYIDELSRFSVKHSNDHTKECLIRMGSPERSFDTIHVAGTNGKGSTSMYMASCLWRAGVRCGLFTSPHLVSMKERFIINGKTVSDERFLSSFARTKKLSLEMEKEGKGHPSYFEFLFLMGMDIFAAEGCGAVIAETGLGGRLDATNAIEKPVLTVITSVSFDHCKYLGDTLTQIAWEKAGIIKKDVPVVYVGTDPRVFPVIEETARLKGAPARALRSSDIVKISRGEGRIDFSTSFRYDGCADFSLNTVALYQTENAALSVLALLVLKEMKSHLTENADAETVRKGLASAVWPGRMERFAEGVYLDGAHNPDGIVRFLESVKAMDPKGTSVLLFASAMDKDSPMMIRELAEGYPWDHVVVTGIFGSRRADTGLQKEIFASCLKSPVILENDPVKAFSLAREKAGEGTVFVCGSLYLVGMIKEFVHDKL